MAQPNPMSEPMTPAEMRTLGIVVGALIFGLASFLIVAILVDPTSGTREAGTADPLATRLLLALVAVGVAEIPLYLVLRGQILAQIRRQLGADGVAALAPAEASASGPSVPRALSGLVILGAALAEGFGLFGTVVYFVTRAGPALAAPVIAIPLLVFLYPTEARLRALAEQLRA